MHGELVGVETSNKTVAPRTQALPEQVVQIVKSSKGVAYEQVVAAAHTHVSAEKAKKVTVSALAETNELEACWADKLAEGGKRKKLNKPHVDTTKFISACYRDDSQNFAQA